jgi:flagellar basal-body rod modification protein FlgD
MSISSILPNIQSDPASGYGRRKTSLDQQDFLNLFITQLKNQSPLNPMDHFQMASQIAQFNSLDTLNRIHQSIEVLNSFQSSMNSLQTAGLIGKKVERESQYLSVQGGRASEGCYQLSRPGKVKIEIYDEKGQLIRTLEEGFKDASRQTLTWDGKSQGGLIQPDGRYSFKVTAVDEKGQPVPVQISRIDTVTKVQFENGQIYLYLGHEKITLGDVKAILNPSS